MASRPAWIARTPGVVTPNIVTATSGASPRSPSTANWTIPAIAFAALASTRRETRLSPATSVTGWTSVRSDVPTNDRTSPDASVDTSSLGTPTGSERSTSETTVEPPLPPRPMTPSTRPAIEPLAHDGRGAAAHRGQGDRPRVAPLPCKAKIRQGHPGCPCDLGGRHIRVERRVPQHTHVDHRHGHARFEQPVPHERVLPPLRVQGSHQDDAGPDRLRHRRDLAIAQPPGACPCQRPAGFIRNGSALNSRTTPETARSTGSRSMEDAPR